MRRRTICAVAAYEKALSDMQMFEEDCNGEKEAEMRGDEEEAGVLAASYYKAVHEKENNANESLVGSTKSRRRMQ